MKLTRAPKKAKLREVAEGLIQQALEWDEENKTPNLTQIEDEVLMLRQHFGQEMVAVMVAGQESQQPVATPTCEKCGAEKCCKQDLSHKQRGDFNRVYFEYQEQSIQY